MTSIRPEDSHRASGQRDSSESSRAGGGAALDAWEIAGKKAVPAYWLFLGWWVRLRGGRWSGFTPLASAA